MTLRRIIVWVLSVAIGAVATFGIITLFGTTLKKFALLNALLMFISTGSLAFIWVDYLFKTEYIRS